MSSWWRARDYTSNEEIMNKEFTEFKSDVLKELSELIKITGDPFLMRTKRSVENDRYNNDINEYVLSGGSPTECVDLLISLDGRGNLTDF